MTTGPYREQDPAPRATVPADVEAPDRIAWGLTARQLATLAVAGTCGYGLHQLLAPLLPPIVLATAAVPVFGLLLAVVLGRRDGLALDRWLLAAWSHHRTPRLQTPTTSHSHSSGSHRRGSRSGSRRGGGGGDGRDGAGLVRASQLPPVPALLNLPARAITGHGVLHLPGRASAVVVGCGTVNLGLRTGTEQAALLAGFGRWLNSLSAPAQIVVSTHRVDLHPHAQTLAAHAAMLPHPALAAAAGDHADYLAELGASRDPLRRQVLLLVHSEPSQPAGAARRGEDTARSLAALGVQARVLDGSAVTAALAAAVDPYAPPTPGGRAAPQAVITTSKEP